MIMDKCKALFIVTLLLFASDDCSFGQIKKLDGERITSLEIDDFVKIQMDSLQMPGLSIAIINDGKIVYNKAFGVVNVDTKAALNEQSVFETASLSKPVFAYFVMKMVDKGILNLDTPLYKYMPYTDIEKDERYKNITARMVLSHQTGFPNWRNEVADSSLHIKRGELYLKFTPGTNFSYSGEGYVYLAKIVAHLTNRTLKNLDSLFQLEVAVPLKMQHASYTGNTYIYQHKASGHENGKVSFKHGDSTSFGPASSLHSDALSYAQFLIGLMNGSGLSEKSYVEILKPQVLVENKGNGYAWGLGIAIKQTPFGVMYEHGGNNDNFQAMFMFSKSGKNGYVFLTNCDKGNVFDKVFVKFLSNGKL